MRTEMDDGELVASDVFQRLGLLVIESRVPNPSPKGRTQGPHCPATVGDTSKHNCRPKDFMVSEWRVVDSLLVDKQNDWEKMALLFLTMLTGFPPLISLHD